MHGCALKSPESGRSLCHEIRIALQIGNANRARLSGGYLLAVAITGVAYAVSR